jgi:hypothetical protein
MTFGLLTVRWTLKLYPRAWRRRFEEELVATWLDEYDARVVTGSEAPARFVGRSVLGRAAAAVPVLVRRRRRAERAEVAGPRRPGV